VRSFTHYILLLMPGKPFQSILIPYRDEIAQWRAASPPMTYAQIAILLKDHHNVVVTPHAVWSFVKTRSQRLGPIRMLSPQSPRPTDIRNAIKTRIKEHKPTTTEQPKDPKWDFSE